MDQNTNNTPNTNTPETPQVTTPTVTAAPVQNEQPVVTPVQNAQSTAEQINQAENQTTTQVTPPSSQPDSKKKVVVMSSVLVVALLLIGSIFYITGVMNSTKRLGQYKKVTTPRVSVKPTQPVMSQEEMDASKIDTGDPETDLKELEQDLSALDN